MLNRKLLCASVVAALASLGVSAHAQDRDWDHHDRNGGYNNGYDRYDHRDGRAMDQRGYDRDGRWAERRDHDARRMGGPERHHWRRGERLPDEYRHGGYVDWRSHRLHAPPRGYQWVEVDGDYVLVALASGIVADLIINSR